MNRFTFGALLAALVVFAIVPCSAQAEAEGTGWEAFAQAYPTNLHPGGGGTIQINVINVGAKESRGASTVTDTLPEGVKAIAAGGMGKEKESTAGLMSKQEEEKVYGGQRWECEGIGSETVTCTSNPEYLKPLPLLTHEPYEFLPDERIGIAVQVKEGVVGTFPNRVSVAGGGAGVRTVVSDPVTLSPSEAGYGFSGWDVWFTNADGSIDTQAGSHPYETTFAVGFDELANGHTAGGELRDLRVALPPGFFGEPNSSPRCTRAQLDAGECPADTQIGSNLAMLSQSGGGGSEGATVSPVYNMVPPPGVVDQFSVNVLGYTVLFDTGPRGHGDYELVTRIDNLPQTELDGNILTLWGVASEASHTPARCTHVVTSTGSRQEECGLPSTAPPRPFLTLPTSCAAPQSFTIEGLGTWEDEGAHAQASVYSHNQLDAPVGFTGCSNLSFNPALFTAPDSGQADTPTGLGVNVTFPQETLRVPETLVESTVKNTTVTLPEGLVVNPGQAAGLQACSEAQAKLNEEGAPACPSASKVGTVKIQTPLLENELESELTGAVYVLASQPPNLELLIAASGDGINLKLPAHVHLDEATGQLTTTLAETPALPFTSFELAFSGGAQAALATPASCGTYTTTSDFTPWASPFIGDSLPSSSFQVTSGPGGGSCLPSPLPFSPELIAGATNPKGGAFTSFSLLLTRGDGQQRIEKLQFKAPEGLSGMLSTVALCGEPQAREGTCSSTSRIGHTSVASGPGPYPLVLPQPGDPEFPIYLTGPYDGAPFGLSIVTPIVAGPFNLGTIVTRAKIEIDPVTAQITVTTDPLPQIVDGVPTDLRLIDSVIDREGFMFNPTRCAPSSFSGTAWGAPPPGVGGPGATAAISDSFDVVGCKGLAFAPKFSVSTSGKTSKADGASLTARVSYPSAPQGTQADIGSVKVDLPKQLPSRLTTLHGACTAAQFDADPAGCPASSVVGHAVVHTPVLPLPLEGPAYFVSNGGEAFPNLIVVLQGEGVTIELVGDTFISKAGITSSTFRAVPDQPFSSFELTLPEGPYSALAANVNLCTSKLAMPTEFVAQNGAVIDQSTPITVTGCTKVKTLTRSEKLKAALKTCHKQKGAKRTACEKAARKHYDAKTSKKKKQQ